MTTPWRTRPVARKRPPRPRIAVPDGPEAKLRRHAAVPDWPEGRLEGTAAKQLLLDTMLAVQERLKNVAGYTATFRKQERIGGVLGPEQTMAMKIRHHPFAVYFKYLSPYRGKGGGLRRGAPRQQDHRPLGRRGAVPRAPPGRPPDHPLALADTRHAITEAGLANLTDKLVGFRRMDLDDPDAVTILDRTTDAEGRPWLRSVHTHPHFDHRRPFARVEVLYDPETRLPLQIENYDWPEPGHQGELLLAERYHLRGPRPRAPPLRARLRPGQPGLCLPSLLTSARCDRARQKLSALTTSPPALVARRARS